ncbi:MAG: hypothetical protein GY937_20205 [bacterium]|nr:hypothetical protein [bacterium]
MRRNTDGKFLALDGQSFVSAPQSVLMSELDRSGLPGIYYYDFDHATADNTADTYVVVYEVENDLIESTWEEVDYFGGVNTETVIDVEDFGGVQERRIYDRRNRAFKPLYAAAFGLNRLPKTRRILSEKNKSTNPVSGAQSQATKQNQSF